MTIKELEKKNKECEARNKHLEAMNKLLKDHVEHLKEEIQNIPLTKLKDLVDEEEFPELENKIQRVTWFEKMLQLAVDEHEPNRASLEERGMVVSVDELYKAVFEDLEIDEKWAFYMDDAMGNSAIAAGKEKKRQEKIKEDVARAERAKLEEQERFDAEKNERDLKKYNLVNEIQQSDYESKGLLIAIEVWKKVFGKDGLWDKPERKKWEKENAKRQGKKSGHSSPVQVLEHILKEELEVKQKSFRNKIASVVANGILKKKNNK